MTRLLVAASLILVLSAASALARCDTQGMRSANTQAERRLVITNTLTNRSMELIWIDHRGERVRYGTIGPGETWAQATFDGHVWALEDGIGTCDAVVRVFSNARVIVE